MTKKTFLAAALLLTTCYAGAQTKLSFAANQIMERYRTEAPSSRNDAETVGAFITLSDASYADKFLSFGYEVTDVIDNIVICDIPLADVDKLCEIEYITAIAFGEKQKPLLDKAREATGVDMIHAGIELPQAYTGKGVTTGLYDTGLDPNHINFKDADGKSRVKAIAVFNRTSSTEYTSAMNISRFTTEDEDETHGTHVLGIMAGGYKGQIFSGNENTDNVYGGVAPESDIIVTCGSLANSEIIKGVKYARDYAVNNGVPMVYNLSLGSNNGPHDGSDSYGKSLNRYGEDIIITVSAGNEGDQKMSVSKTFTEDDREFCTTIYPTKTTDNYGGMVEFWASDNRPFKFKIIVSKSAIGKRNIVDEAVIDKVGQSISVGGGTSGATIKLKDFDKACSASGMIQASSRLDANSKRYVVEISHIKLKIAPSTATVVGFVIEGEPGQRIDGYANGNNDYAYISEFSNRGISGWLDGSTDGTINDLACGPNVIAIGAYNTRNVWPAIGDGSFRASSRDFPVGDVSYFTSYGTTYDGRDLPDVCAPGAMVVSSYNSYYIKANSNQANAMTAKLEDSKIDYYWGSMQGTSQASPFAAGVFALWLQADPTLTVSDIRNIVKETALRDKDVENGIQKKWGAGKIDAYEGLKKVLSSASVSEVLADKAILIQSIGSNMFDIFAQGASEVSAELFSLNGMKVAGAVSSGDSMQFDASGVAKGVYVLRVAASGNTRTKKIVL